MNRASSAKALDQGANPIVKTMKNIDGVREYTYQAIPAAKETAGSSTAYSSLGRVGQTFKPESAIGGPFAKDGAIEWINSFPSCYNRSGPNRNVVPVGVSDVESSSGCEELEREWRRKGGQEWEIGEWVETLLEVVPFVG